MFFLDQLVDDGINVGSRYAQSTLEMLVLNLSSCLRLHSLHSEEDLLSHIYVLFIGFYVKYQMQSVPCECGRHLTIMGTTV
jgi:hypothetical protein